MEVILLQPEYIPEPELIIKCPSKEEYVTVFIDQNGLSGRLECLGCCCFPGCVFLESSVSRIAAQM